MVKPSRLLKALASIVARSAAFINSKRLAFHPVMAFRQRTIRSNVITPRGAYPNTHNPKASYIFHRVSSNA